MVFLLNLNKFSYLKYFCSMVSSIWTLISHTGEYTLTDFNISYVSQDRSYKKATSKKLLYNWKHFLFYISNSLMHSFHKEAFSVLGSIFDNAKHIHSWNAGSPHIRVYNYVREKKILQIYLKGSVRQAL